MARAGEKTKVQICIDPQATNHPLGYWDSGAQNWAIADGAYQIFVGSSAANIVLNDAIVVRKQPGGNENDGEGQDEGESCGEGHSD